MKVWLATKGNPERGENPNEQLPGVPNFFLPVSSLKSAVEGCQVYMKTFEIEPENWDGGYVVDEEGNLTAYITHNGQAADLTHLISMMQRIVTKRIKLRNHELAFTSYITGLGKMRYM